MDEYIKQSIEARKSALISACKLSAEDQKKVDALFAEIEKLGAGCKDASEFEAEFSKSPLNQKYLDMFTELATKSAGVGATVAKSVAGGIVGGVADRAVQQVERTVLPTRAAVHQKAYDEVRKVPGLGDAIDLGETASYSGHLGKLFGGKKKKDEE